MQFRIDAHPPGPLSVLPELPDAPLAVLEGFNGIGKSLAVRILQLCTGEMPYRTSSPAWASLCAGLGEFTVTVTGLSGAKEIRWEADSRDWAGETAEGSVGFRALTVDGQTADVAAVRALLVVHRLAGDEGIVETLAQQADAEADLVRRWRGRHASTDGSPLARMESSLAGVGLVLGDWSPERYRQIRSAVEDANRVVERAAERANAAVTTRDAFVEADGLRRRGDLLSRKAPDLEERIAEVDREIETLRAERDRTQDEMMSLAADVAGADVQIRELTNARRTRDRNREQLSLALDAAAAAASDAGIESTPGVVVTATSELSALLEELEAQQTAMDAAPVMRRLLDDTAAVLAGAEQQGLGDQVAFDDPETDVQLTVAQTRAGMLARRGQLEGQPPPPQALHLADQIADVHARLKRAADAIRWFDEADRRWRLLAKNQERFDRALAASNPGAVERLQSLEHRRRESDERMLELATQRAALRQQLSIVSAGETREVVEARYSEILRRVGIGPEQLDSALADAERAVDATQADVASARERLVGARRDVTRVEAEIRRATAALTESTDFEWMRRSLPTAAVPVETGTVEQQAAALHRTAALLDKVSDRLGAHRAQLGAVDVALQGLAEHIRGREPVTREYLPQLQEWLGRRFSDWFNVPRVRSELLPEADGPVTVDLERLEVKWSEKGAARSRPLEAFSSGEQAFAYTRARVAILDQENHRPANRLIVLDEFGAFIAHDRLAGLLAYLKERTAEHPHDQVLVVLPLSRDYRDDATRTVGDSAERFERSADEIEQHGYTVRELT